MQGQAAAILPRNHHIHSKQSVLASSFLCIRSLSRFTHGAQEGMAHHRPFWCGRVGALSMLQLRWEGTTTEDALYMVVLTELKIGGRTP